MVTGGTGFVGRFIVEHLLGSGHEVRITGRKAPKEGFFSKPVAFFRAGLEEPEQFEAALSGADCLVHAAFDHLPGRYRGGEGNDPEGFGRRNLDGTIALFEGARQAGVSRAVFLSSRAVYGSRWPTGVLLEEAAVPRPDTLYGEVKLVGEHELERLSGSATFCGVSLRLTGVYGSAGKGAANKWDGLFRDYLAGRQVPVRVGTEVHGADVASAVLLMLESPADAVRGRVFNVSDVTVDTRDILEVVQAAKQVSHPLPPASDKIPVNAMSTAWITALGWRPGGMALFRQAVRRMALQFAE